MLMPALLAARRHVRGLVTARRALLAVAYSLLVVSCDSPLGPDGASVSRIEVSPLALTLVVGDARPVTARVVGEGGKTLSDRRLFWATQNPGIASVSQAGIVTGVAPGSGQIAVSSGGKSAVVPVTVASRPVSLVRVTPTTATVQAGATVALSAQAVDAAGGSVSGRTVLWTTSSAVVATVTSTGVVAGVTAGNATISASVDGVVGSALVTVQPVPVSAVTLSPATSALIVGQQLQLTATPTDAVGNALPGRSSTWSSNAPTVASVSSTGLVTALARGNATITVTTEGKSATSRVAVSLVPVDTVSVTPRTSTLAAGRNVQLEARLVDSSGAVLTGRTVTWDTDQPTIATVSGSGLVTAISTGRASITATADGKSGTATVTVTPVPVASLVITPGSATILVGGTQQLTATARDASNNLLPGRIITWISGAPSVATVTQGGLVSAVGPGSALIFAASEGVAASVTVTVSSVGVSQVRIIPPSGSVQQGKTLQLAAQPLDAGGNVITGRTVIWNSAAPAVASVSSTGLVVGVAVGSANITATVDGVVGTAPVTVTSTPVAAVSVLPSAQTIPVGSTLLLTLIITDAAGNPLSTVGRTINWSSFSPSVAAVSASGIVTAVATGSATIQVSVDGVLGGSAITVTNIPVTAVTVAPSSVPLNIGATQQLSSTAKDAGGNVLLGRAVTWTSSNPSVASVSGTGLVTALAVGSAQVTATVDGVQGSATVTVSSVPVATVTVTPNPTSVTEFGTTTLTAVAKDASGTTLTGRTIVWSSSNNAFAAVSQTGVVTAIAPTPSGSPVTIRAEATGAGIGGTSPFGTSALTVSYAAVTSVSVTPPTITTAVGSNAPATASLFAGALALSAAGRTVTWSITPTTIATVNAATGMVTGVAIGSATLTVTASSPGQAVPVTSTASVAVSAVPVASVLFDPFVGTLHNGTLYRRLVSAKTLDASGGVITGRQIFWRTPAADAPFLTIDSTNTLGVTTITAKAGPVAGLRLIAEAGGTATPDTLFFTSDLVPVASVTLTPGTATVVAAPQSTQVTLSSTPRDSAGTLIDASNGNPLGGRTPTWTSSDVSLATVTSGGIVSGVAKGTANVTATIGGTISAVPSVITVLAAVNSVTVTLARDSVIATNPTLGTVTGIAKVLDASSVALPGRAVAIATGSSSIATVSPTSGTSDVNGEVAFTVTGVGGGTTTTVTSTASGITGTSATLRVLRPVATITLAATPAGADSVIGTTTLPITATLRDAVSGAVAGRPCTLSSGAMGTATVSIASAVSNASGQVAFTATGVAPSATPATLTVSCEGINGPFPLRVLPPVASLTIASATLADSVIGTGTLQMVAVLKDAGGATIVGRPVTWTAVATPGGAATIAASTGLLTGTLTAGLANVTATSESVSSASFAVRVLPAVNSITITAPDSSLTVGDAVQATAVLKDAGGNTLTGRPVTWTSTVTRVATVSSSGLIAALDSGSTTIAASAEGKSGSIAPVTVALVPVASVSIVPATATMNVGDTLSFTAVPKDAAGNPLSNRATMWFSANGALLRVDVSTGSVGRYTALDSGTVGISAVVESSKTGNASVTIKLVPIVSVTLTPSAPTVAVGSPQTIVVEVKSATAGLQGRFCTILGSNNAVANLSTMSGTTNASGQISFVATGVATGTSTITVTCDPTSSLPRTGTATVTVP